MQTLNDVFVYLGMTRKKKNIEMKYQVSVLRTGEY